jgi:hypothetical protein
VVLLFVYTDHSLVGPIYTLVSILLLPLLLHLPSLPLPRLLHSIIKLVLPQRVGVTSLLHPLHQGGSPLFFVLQGALLL